MLIMKPQVDGVHWDSDEGVILWVSSYLHPNAHTPPEYRAQPVDGDIPINITVLVSGRSAPTVEVKSKPFLRYVPGAMEAIHEWVSEHGLVGIWEQELAIYNTVLESVLLPGIKPQGQGPTLEWVVPMSVSGLPNMEVVVIATEKGAKAQLQIATGIPDDGGDEVYQLLDEYEMRYPVTIYSIKSKVLGTMKQYLNCLCGAGPVNIID